MHRLLFATILLAGATASAHAQLAVPRLNSIFPCGGRQGTTIDCTIAGGELSDVSALYFSHPGLTAQPIGNGKFKVSIAADVPLGVHDVRAVTPLGVSNFRAFAVGDVAEVQENEPNNEPEKAERVSLPVVVNGRMDGGTDVDCFTFTAKKGQRIVLDCRAWRLDSQLDGTLQITGPGGKDVAYSGDHYGKDPLADFTAAEEGDYTVKIWDFVYSGGGDYFYRLHISSLPHIDALLPAALRPGAKNKIRILGRNLPGGQPAPGDILGRPLEMITREIDVPAEAALKLQAGEAIRPQQTSLDGLAFRLTSPEGASNALFLGFTSDPIVLEQEPNHDAQSAQRLAIPSDVTGTFGAVGDKDYYTFSARKGEKIVVEMIAERQSGLIDPLLAGFDPKGKRVFSAENGGALRNIGQIRFTTQTRDVRWDLTAPADGDYTVMVRDHYFQQRGSPRFTYRLSVRRPQPDFRLVVVPTHETQPDAAVVGRGSRHWLDVLAFRSDGFDGPIQVEASDLPAGVSCEPVVIGPGRTSAPLVFLAAKDAPDGHAAVRVTGKAHIDDRDVSRVARGGGLTWGTTNTPGVARMTQSILLAVRNPAPFALRATPTAIKAAAGEKIPLHLTVDRASNWADSVQLSGFDLPQGVTIPLVTVGKGVTEGKVEVALPMNLKPGVYSFTVNGAGQAPRDFLRESDSQRAKAPNVRAVFPSNPITLTVEAPEKK